MKTPQVNIIAPINKLGYGVTGANLTAALSKITKVGLIPIHPTIDTESWLADTIKDCVRTGTIPTNSPTIRIWHQHDMRLFGSGPRIGFPIFELDRFTPTEKANLGNTQYLFVCSEWAREIIRPIAEEFGIPVGVVPLGYDPEIFKLNPYIHKRSMHSTEQDTFTFFNAGKWEIRKGHGQLPHMFAKAFGPTFRMGGLDVRLRMMCDNPFLSNDENNDWKNYYRRLLGDAVEFIPRTSSATGVAKAMSECDAALFPALAEGWNLELLECIAVGLPAVATGYSAHNDFCPASYLVPTTKLELAYDGKWFHGNGNWAAIDDEFEEEFIDKCRKLVDDDDGYYARMVADGNHTRETFTWDNSAERIKQHLTYWGM